MSKKFIIGIDTGDKASGYICHIVNNGDLLDYQIFDRAVDRTDPSKKGKNPGNVDNEQILKKLLFIAKHCKEENTDMSVHIERLKARAATVGQTTFEACEWTGRFESFCKDKLEIPVYTHYVTDHKSYFCGRPNATDRDVREAMIEFYQFKDTRNIRYIQDRTYVKHEWLALSVATYGEKILKGETEPWYYSQQKSCQ